MNGSPDATWAEVEKAWLDVEGYPAFQAWFERTPTFHDAIIEGFSTDIDRGVQLTLRASRMLSEVDERGFYKHDKHVRARLALTGVMECDLIFDDTDKIVSLLQVHRVNDGLQMEIEGISGLQAKITARRISLDFEPIDAVA